jgi:hypothetical protein
MTALHPVEPLGTVLLQSSDSYFIARLLGAGLGLTFAVVVSGVLAVLVAAVAPRLTDQSLRKCRDDGFVAFLAGLGVSILVPIALIVLAVTVVGLIVAVPGFVVLFVVLLAGAGVGVLLFGRFVLGVLSSSARDPDTLVAAFVGATVLVLVSLIPILGGLVNFAVSTTGVGAVSLVLWRRYRGP